MSIKIKKFAIYCRVSTVEQDPETQEIRLIEYCKQQGWEYDIYTEVQSTRKTRPIKAELMARLRAGQYTGVLVYRLDRFARSSTELILDVQELINKGIAFISLTENLNFSTSAGKLQFQILSAFAEFERDLISERTKEGMRRARMNGKQPGRPLGSKDKKKRRKAGYLLREAGKKQKTDQKRGKFQDIENYIE